jgi:hypothetical protein
MKKVDAEQPQQRDLRIGHEDLARRLLEALRDREPALDPCRGSARSALKLVDLCMHDGGGDRKHRIVRRRSERLGSVRHRQRLGIVRAQAQDEPVTLQQPSAHRMLGSVAESAYARSNALFASGWLMPCTWVADTPRSVASESLQRVAPRLPSRAMAK